MTSCIMRMQTDRSGLDSTVSGMDFTSSGLESMQSTGKTLSIGLAELSGSVIYTISPHRCKVTNPQAVVVRW